MSGKFSVNCGSARTVDTPCPADACCRSLACESLHLLQAAVPWLPIQLVAEDLWGSLVGMFELNNLAVQVQSPVELFFLAVDDLDDQEKTAVQPITQPWLDALDTDYDVCCMVGASLSLMIEFGCIVLFLFGSELKELSAHWTLSHQIIINSYCEHGCVEDGLSMMIQHIKCAGNSPVFASELHESQQQSQRRDSEGR